MIRAALFNILFAAAALALPAAVVAEEVTLYLMEVPPLTLNEPGRKGIAGDITLEALKRAGYSDKLVVVPNVRAMVMVRSATSRDELIIPLARQAAREPHYTWIAPIVQVNRAFFSLGRKAESFEQARTMFHTIAVARGSAGLNILHEQGFDPKQIYEVADGVTASMMLVAGRVDAWYGPSLQFKSWLRETDPQGQVSMGAMLGSDHNYLACSKVCNPELVRRLSKAIEQMRRDGTLRAIEARYEKGNGG